MTEPTNPSPARQAETAADVAGVPQDAPKAPGDTADAARDATTAPKDGTTPPGDGTNPPGDHAKTPGDHAKAPETPKAVGDSATAPGDGGGPPGDKTPGDKAPGKAATDTGERNKAPGTQDHQTRPGPPRMPVPAAHGHPPMPRQAPPNWPAVPPMHRPPGPRPPSVLTRRWPGPSGPAGRAVLVGAAATGVAAAVAVPLSRPGIGWVLAGLVGAVSAAVAARSADARVGPARIAWGVTALALLGAGTIRAAGWLFVLCLLTAAVAAALAAAGGRSLAGMVAGVVAWPFGVMRSLPWGVRGLAATRRTGGGSTLRTVLVVVVTLILLLVFGSLLSSADEAFAKVIGTVLPDLDAASVVRWIFLFVVGVLGLLGTAFLVSAPPDLSGLERPGTGRLRRLDWMLPVLALDVLFGVFVVVQFTVLFGGVKHVLGPDGPDFAEYARKGFWQLLAVTLLTLVVLGIAARWAPREARADRVAVRLLLGGLSLFSLVIVASAFYRMHVYQEAYGFTQLRLLVSVCELWLGGLFVMVLAAGVRLRASWLPGVAVATAMAALLGIVALNPDRFIAERNVDRYAEINRIDVQYLSNLSADAVPALDRLPADLRACALEEIADDLAHSPDTWNAWNLGRHQAREILAERPSGRAFQCYTLPR